MKSETLIVLIVFLFIGTGGFVLINNAIETTDINTWAFTGHEIAAGLLPAMPYFWLVAFLIMFIYTIAYQRGG